MATTANKNQFVKVEVTTLYRICQVEERSFFEPRISKSSSDRRMKCVGLCSWSLPSEAWGKYSNKDHRITWLLKPTVFRLRLTARSTFFLVVLFKNSFLPAEDQLKWSDFWHSPIKNKNSSWAPNCQTKKRAEVLKHLEFSHVFSTSPGHIKHWLVSLRYELRAAVKQRAERRSKVRPKDIKNIIYLN